MSKAIRLSVIAETKKYQAEMAKIPGVTEKQAARAALKFEKEMSKAQAKAAAQAAKAAKKSGSAWASAMSTAAGVLSADMIKAFAGAVVGIGQEIADLRNELGDLSAATGVSSGALAGLRLAAEASGNSLSSMTGAIKGFPKRLADAAVGVGSAAKALEELNFSAEDANRGLQDSDAAFRDVIERLQGVEDTGERAALAAQIFGKAGVDLMQVLGDKRLEEFTFVAQRFGTDVGPAAIKSAQDWEANVTLLGYAFDGAKAGLFDATVGTAAFNDAIKFAIKTGVFWAKAIQNIAGSLDLLDLVIPGRNTADFAKSLERARVSTLLYMQELELATSATTSASAASAGLSAELDEVAEGAGKASGSVSKLTQASDELAKIGRDAFREQLTEQEKLLAGYSKQLARVAELEELTGQAAPDTRATIEENQAKALAELEEKLWSERMARIDQTEAEEDRASADRQVRADAEHANKMAKLAEFRDVSLTVANAIADIAIGITEATAEREAEAFAATVERLDQLRDQRREANDARDEQEATFADRQKQIDSMTSERARAAAQEQLDADAKAYNEAEALEAALQGRKIENTKTRMEDQRKSARQAAKAAKQAALLGVAVNTSAAILQAFALFGPPPSPAGIAGAASATAAGIFQAAAIRRQKLPTAHSGEFIQPDETIRKVRSGEAVLNQRAAADLGGRQGIDALNRGSGTGSIVIQSVVDGRIVSEAVARQLARRSGTIDQIMRQGRRPLGQLSPYGG